MGSYDTLPKHKYVQQMTRNALFSAYFLMICLILKIPKAEKAVEMIHNKVASIPYKTASPCYDCVIFISESLVMQFTPECLYQEILKVCFLKTLKC